jgi:hypothetical protein
VSPRDLHAGVGLTRVRAHVETLSFRGIWALLGVRVAVVQYTHDWSGVLVVLCAEAPDVQAPGANAPMQIRARIPFSQTRDPDAIDAAILAALEVWLDHEAREGFWRGDRQPFDPHASRSAS